VTKASYPVEDCDDVALLREQICPYVSRGGFKLEAALKEFDICPEQLICADIGASTGGFTDCLLKNGATRVYAFDSGKGQLHRSLATDERVISRESFNARYITRGDVGEDVDLAVMDVSFISQTVILPALKELLGPSGIIISLIKPQFEAGRQALGKNGIVTRKEDRYSAVVRVLDSAELIGLSCRGLMVSPIKGGDGNEEYLACFVRSERKSDFSIINKENAKSIVYGNIKR
jgi:23S rRNA (cytidine1920-2'-O)/16S rRNA (cytidine1409-2'-O)-methyltransferase